MFYDTYDEQDYEGAIQAAYEMRQAIEDHEEERNRQIREFEKLDLLEEAQEAYQAALDAWQRETDHFERMMDAWLASERPWGPFGKRKHRKLAATHRKRLEILDKRLLKAEQVLHQCD